MSDLDDLEEIADQAKWSFGGHRSRKSFPLKCSHGHAMTPENTRIQKQNGYVKRKCRECGRIAAREYYARQQAARTSPAPPR